jgi:DNA polymerase III alpha subunit (gram-positive type)
MKPESPETVDYASLSQIGVSRQKLELHTLHGVDQEKGLELMLRWVEKLELPPQRRLCVIAQNWPFDRQFVMNWMGKSLFNDIFHPHYRDLIPTIQFINDLYYTKGADVTYRQCNLGLLCRHFGIDNTVKHEALNDAVATAEVYRRILSRYSAGFVPGRY